ncbi:sensor domain-containing diguanylate cyclase [Saliniradius amylolyticus]|uniref:sensor domain-containing diguanylate cyclase n=1 Tax=Saliniradius amylolyticus TaxID=2183582 RepID=UPI0013A574B8|nr:diguanylate cyclase [Saliniradius amylolyticus]
MWLYIPFAQAQSDLNVSALDGSELTGHAEYLTTSPEMGLEVVRQQQWQPFTNKHINQGIGAQAHWLRFNVTNHSNDALSWVIRSETSYLDTMQVFYTHDDGPLYQQTLSDRVAFHQRPLNDRLLATPITTPAGARTAVYLKAYNEKPDSVSLNFTLYNQRQFEQQRIKESLLFGLYYGALTTIMILSAVAAVFLRQPAAIYYSLFMAMSILFWLMFNGLGYQYIWPDWPYWHNEGFHIVFLAFCISACQFGRHFLDLPGLFPLFNRVVQLFQWACAGFIAIRVVFGLYEPALHASFLSLALVAVILPVAGWRSWRKGNVHAMWFFIAWVAYSLGVLINLVAASFPLLDWGMSSLVWLQLTSIAEIILLMVAMTSWVVNMKKDREKALLLAHQDPLTKLGNRRQLQVAYENYRARFPSLDHKLFILMIDLDYFKEINDTYGHDAGDKVLKTLSRLIKQNCRESDVAVRYGGEEFAVLLALDSLEQARHVAERIRQQFESQPTQYHQQSIHHTLSCGIAEVLSENIELDANAMMRCADEALYSAKKAGRNLTYTYEAEGCRPITTS